MLHQGYLGPSSGSQGKLHLHAICFGDELTAINKKRADQECYRGKVSPIPTPVGTKVASVTKVQSLKSFACVAAQHSSPLSNDSDRYQAGWKNTGV